MSGIIKHSLGIVRTILIWAIVGAAGIIVYQHFTAKENMPEKAGASDNLINIKEKAVEIKNEINSKLPVIKDKISETGKIIINKVSPQEEKAGMQEILETKPAPEQTEEASDVNNKSDNIDQQDIFKRQVAIVNDLMQ